MWIRSLSDADDLEQCGAKAVGLAKLLAAGLPVPDGFVLTDRAFRDVVGEQLAATLDQLANAIAAAVPPAPLLAELARRAGPLERLAVRSSISLEDQSAGAAAGVFSSVLAVPPAELWPAITAVWASVCTPLAAAYARLHLRANPHTPLSVGVIVQRYVPGERLTVYTREPGAPDSPLAWIERARGLQKLPRDAHDPIVTLALRAERALGLARGADVELIAHPGDDGAMAVVQARPIVHPVLARKVPAPPAVVSALVADGRCWTADLAHNPEPLSPAQAGLVQRIEHEGASPYMLRLCAGTLYSSPRTTIEAAAPASAEELHRRFAAIEERAVAALGAEAPHDLAATIEAYLRFYRIWACELSPLVAAARRLAAASGPRADRLPRPSSVEAQLSACAAGRLSEAELLTQIGDLSSAWDVAAPTLAETPAKVATALAHARWRLAQRVPAVPAVPDPAVLDQAALPAAAAELAERDDLWFARAQARVRRALLTRGRDLGLGDEIFWIPLEEALALPGPDEHGAAARGDDDDDAHHRRDLDGARARAAGARAAHRRAAGWRMPAVVGGVAPVTTKWRGVGVGGQVSGHVVHVSTMWDPPALPLGAIAVTPAVTPALAIALAGVAAIVSETGGLLDHGAAMARELGIPCVVGCADAMSLPSHARVLIDGDRGLVTMLDPA
jgi:phosphohistidine swiveling domain-containing protein